MHSNACLVALTLPSTLHILATVSYHSMWGKTWWTWHCCLHEKEGAWEIPIPSQNHGNMTAFHSCPDTFHFKNARFGQSKHVWFLWLCDDLCICETLFAPFQTLKYGPFIDINTCFSLYCSSNEMYFKKELIFLMHCKILWIMILDGVDCFHSYAANRWLALKHAWNILAPVPPLL